MSKRRIPKGAAKKIARERIDLLFRQSEVETRSGRAERAKRYVGLARRIGMRYNVSLGHWKRYFCPVCNSYYLYPTNATTRLKKGRIIITCRNCGEVSRFPFRR